MAVARSGKISTNYAKSQGFFANIRPIGGIRVNGRREIKNLSSDFANVTKVWMEFSQS